MYCYDLTDSQQFPKLIKLNGTEWEFQTLRENTTLLLLRRVLALFTPVLIRIQLIFNLFCFLDNLNPVFQSTLDSHDLVKRHSLC